MGKKLNMKKWAFRIRAVHVLITAVDSSDQHVPTQYIAPHVTKMCIVMNNIGRVLRMIPHIMYS